MSLANGYQENHSQNQEDIHVNTFIIYSLFPRKSYKTNVGISGERRFKISAVTSDISFILFLQILFLIHSKVLYLLLYINNMT